MAVDRYVVGRAVKMRSHVSKCWRLLGPVAGGDRRTRARQGHAADRGGGMRRLFGFTDVPLADAIGAAAFEKINMDVVLMRAIRARPQHGRELGTSALPQAFAKVLGDVRVRKFHYLSVGKPKRMDIECIR